MKKSYWLIKKFVIFFACSVSHICFSQADPGFGWPIDTPHTITGNYGELRPNHFHMGWDFSTNGKINFPVYAVADGFVSRIKVSSTGYGKALYITSPGNKLSLFAHLTAYAGAIAETVKTQQMEKKSYELELFPASGELRVLKGQLIGYSGNSGNSSGPHLHFEIRDEKTEVPLNLALFYKLADTVKPIIKQIAFYDLSDTSRPFLTRSFNVKTTGKDGIFMQKDSITVDHAIIGFAFSGFDRFVVNGNPNVIYKGTLYLDDRLIFGYSMNDISFDKQRYVNEFSQVINKVKYQKCFLPENYPRELYQDCVDKGRIRLTDTTYHRLNLVVTDERGNGQSVQVWIKNRKAGNVPSPLVNADAFVDCHKDFKFSGRGLQVLIPARTLYYSTPIICENQMSSTGKISILPASLNLASPFKLTLHVPEKLKEKGNQRVLINGSAVYCPVVKGDSLVYSVYSFGQFKMEQDTVPPKIKTKFTLKKIKRLKNINSFSFLLRDNLSGLGRYNLYLDGEWVLAEFDAKSNLLTYFFDETTPVGNLSFRVEAEDKVGNASEYKFVLKK